MSADSPALEHGRTAGMVAIIGAGATGTTLAALLGRVAPVAVVCRNAERAAALRQDGARVTGLLTGASRPLVLRSIADLGSIGPLRAIFVTTKTTAIAAVARDLRAAAPGLEDADPQGDGPYIVSFQNGIEPGRELMRQLHSDRVLRMVLNFGASSPQPRGAAHAALLWPPSFIGCLVPSHRHVCLELAALLTAAGLATEFTESIELRVWAKGVINAAMNPVAALVNSTVGEVLDSPARMLVERLLHEGAATAAADGLDLGEPFIDRAWATLEKARGHTPSMVEDIRAGRESEIGQLNRQIIEHARPLGVPVPTHEVVDALIETFDWKVYLRRPEARGRLEGAA